jgi:hypothetical protein
MQSTGQTSTQDLSFTSMHGSVMMYVTIGSFRLGARRAARLTALRANARASLPLRR